jgi:hypothetical protein
VTTLVVLGAVAAVVLAVVFHVILAQSQLALDRIGEATTREQREYDRRRLEVAERSAPERIISAAAYLGLVEPNEPPQYLLVQGAKSPKAGASGATPSTLSGWDKVKRHLGDEQP